MSQNINQILFNIYENIKSVVKICNFPIQNIKKESTIHIMVYAINYSLHQIRQFIIQSKKNEEAIINLNDEYLKLENDIQIQEEEIRNRIGIQNHLRLQNQQLQGKLMQYEKNNSYLKIFFKSGLQNKINENKLLVQQNIQLKQKINKLKQSTFLNTSRTIERNNLEESSSYIGVNKSPQTNQKQFKQIEKSPFKKHSIQDVPFKDSINNIPKCINMKDKTNKIFPKNNYYVNKKRSLKQQCSMSNSRYLINFKKFSLSKMSHLNNTQNLNISSKY